MPITKFEIVTGQNLEDLNLAIEAGGFAPVGPPMTTMEGKAFQSVGVGGMSVGAVSGYKIITARTPVDLVPLVQVEIDNGFQPVGGIGLLEHAYFQGVGIYSEGSGGGVGSDYVLPKASTTVLGGVKLATNSKLIGPVEPTTSTSGRTYIVQEGTGGAMFVNVPWVSGAGGGGEATEPNQFVPLFQVEAMIAASRKSIEDGIIDIINGAIGQ